jgi:hypothetical protein
MEMKLSPIALLVSCLCIGSVLPYPTQVPNTPAVCKNMIPGHGPSPQKTKSPYTVTAWPRRVNQGDAVQVVLSGEGGEEFKGFYLQARTADGTPIGTFTPTDTIKVHSCGDGKNNAAFHGVRGLKDEVEVFWNAPKDFQGDVTFTSSFVSEFEQFWTQVKAPQPVTVKA